MKKTKIFLPLLAAGLVLGMGLTACNKPAGQSGSQPASQAQPSSAQQQKIKVSAAGDKKQLLIGETVQLNADIEGVKWESSDAKIASVDDKGLVTAVAFGEVTISATKEGYAKGTIGLTVTRPAPNATFDLTTAADHYSADGWWELSGGMFAMQTVNGWNPIAQQSSWGQQSEEPAETFIGGFGQGDKETVKFTSSKAVKGELVLNMGNSNAVTLKEVMSVKLNGKAVNIDAIELEDHPGDWGSTLEFGEVSLGQLDIAASNTLEFEFLTGTNIFLNELVVYAGDAKVELTAPAAKEQIEVVEAELEVIEGQTVSIQVKNNLAGVSYASVDEATATVDAKGVVTGVAKGITNITVKKDGMYSVRVKVTVKPAPVAGQILVEAESAEELQGEEKPSGVNVSEDGGMSGGNTVHSGSAYIMIFGAEGEITLTYKFNASKAGKMGLSVVGSAPMSMGGEAAPYVIKDSMGIKLNGADVTASEEAVLEAAQGFGGEMSEAFIAAVDVVKGENILVITLSETYPSLDVFKLSELK